ncbi:DUF5115 domain-containing protein [uncultured Bacteroides sp.]|uniref:DUF5115 domain-containing protein n=1 Tax=uncultured Bacteroides sp. TaxID=162156 RepID=UPI0025DA605B|nr:DUF5115 domain-containing protein [uncultured Bacteroides sp.]
MKKILFYTLLTAVAFTTVSCDEDFNEDVAAPQTWPQEEAITLPGFAATATGSVDLASGDSVAVFNYTTPSDLPAGTTIDKFRLELIPDGIEGAKAVTVNASANGKVASADLQKVIEDSFGKRPVERTLNANLYADLMKEGQASLLTCDPIIIKATPKAPQISQHYYIIGDPSKWEPAETSLAFNHSGKDVYDDPIFTVVFPVTDGEVWFAITDDITVEKNDWAYVIGCAEGNGNNGMEGKLARRSDIGNDGSFKIVVDGDASFVKVTLNMMEYSYQIEKLNFAEYIYEVGNNNNWGNDGHPVYALQGPAYDGVYHGAMYLKSGFKFRSNAADWNGSGNWGLNANKEEGILVNDGGSSDIALTKDGFYKIVVDLAKMTYSLTPFEQLGIIGDGQPGGWDNDTPLTYDEAEDCWKAAGVELTAGKSIKFRTIGSWDIVNIGGASLSNLVFNSNDNIQVEESGTFTVKLFLETQGKPYATLVKE